MKNLLTTTALIAAFASPPLAIADGHSGLDPDAQYGGNITISVFQPIMTEVQGTR